MRKYPIITVILVLFTFVFVSVGCFGGDDGTERPSGSESIESGVSGSLTDSETKGTENSETVKTEYAVKFVSDGEEVYEIKVKSGETTERPEVPTKEHYFLSGWYDGDNPWNFETGRISSDITLVAKWTPEVYTVTFVTEAGDTPTSQTVTYDPVNGKAVEPNIKKFVKTSAYEYEFIGWYLGETEWSFDNIVEKNIKLVARWNKNTAIGVLPSD